MGDIRPIRFSDISHFYRTFIHEMNITPKEYQKLAHARANARARASFSGSINTEA